MHIPSNIEGSSVKFLLVDAAELKTNATLASVVMELARRGGTPHPMVYVVEILSLEAVLARGHDGWLLVSTSF